MSRARPVVAVTVACLGVAPATAVAQADVTLELGASQIGAAVGADTDDARFAIGGLRASHYRPNGTGIYASFLGGQVFGDSVGGSFASGVIEATLRDQWSPSWSGGLETRFLGFGIKDPFPYRTLATELGTSVRHRTAHTSFEVGARGGIGHSRVELWRRVGGLTRVFEDDLWRVGGDAELLVGSPSVQVGVVGSSHKTSGETYTSLGGRLVFGGDWGVVEVRADRWDTPLGPETTGGVAMVVPLGGWSFRAFFGRPDPDPLTLAQPGTGSGGVLLGRSLYSSARTLGREGALHEVLTYSDSGSRVRLTVDAPDGAARVQLLGDFTLWEPIPMTRAGDRWVAEVDVPVGTHHFGFLVDDEWYVPADAPDVVPDEWGRASATLVIEGAGS